MQLVPCPVFIVRVLENPSAKCGKELWGYGMKAGGGLVEFAISDALSGAAEDAQVARVLPRPCPTDWSGDSSLTIAGAMAISCGTPSWRFLVQCILGFMKDRSIPSGAFKPSKPTPKVERIMHPISHDYLHRLIKKAPNPPASKLGPKAK